VQTVTGKGYRFIAQIEEVSPPANDAVPTVASATSVRSLTASDSVSSIGKGLSSRRWPFVLGISVVLIIALGVYVRHLGSPVQPQASKGRVMLAVLPFENLTGDAAQEYFADGMTEEMITQLGSLNPEHFGVIARTSVMHYKHSQYGLVQIGRELGVQYALEGSVRRDFDKVRITAQLIQVRDQTHLWARQYDRELPGLLALQGEIAQDISDEIRSALGENRTKNPVSQPALSPQAYEAYDL
jgi:TolB-like protein